MLTTLQDYHAPRQYREPRLTTRAVLDPTRLCHLRCDFCYYLPDDDFHDVKEWPEQVKQVEYALSRGCDSVDITGGEPMENPHIVELVALCTQHGLSTRIITSFNCHSDKTLDAVMAAGVCDWLVSMHGAKAETHNAIVHVPTARKHQLRRLARIADKMDYCCNYVMIEANQTEMADWAKMMLNLTHQPPKVVNFINYNPHYGASQKIHDMALANVVDYRIAGPILNEAISILEAEGVGVNCRYTPMCHLYEEHRKSVCNDLHVALDFGEWINGIEGSTLEDAERYGKRLSANIEEQGEPCHSCGLKQICGGANKAWHTLSLEKFGCETLTKQPEPVDLTHPAYWYYRRENVLGLDPRR